MRHYYYIYYYYNNKYVERKPRKTGDQWTMKTLDN